MGDKNTVTVMPEGRFDFISSVSGFKEANGKNYSSHLIIMGYLRLFHVDAYHNLMMATNRNLNIEIENLKEVADKTFEKFPLYDGKVFNCTTPEEVFAFMKSKGIEFQIL